MPQQIKLVDFRNASYQGCIKDGQFHKIGAILTEDFLLCLSAWRQGNLDGPCFTLFPNQKIFYGQFINNSPEGICCYEMGNQCQIYCIFQNGKMKSHLVSIFPQIECVLDLVIGQTEQVEHIKQYDYKGNDQKWEIVQRLMRVRIPNKLKKFNKFISSHFVPHFQELQQAFGQEYFVGFKGEGLGLKIDLEEQTIKSVGFYSDTNTLKLMGKKIISRQKRVREEGIYNKPQTLLRYQTRPDKVKKNYRDHFRLSINFENSFLQIPALQKIQKQFNKLKIKIKDSTTHRIAQQLIEHLDDTQIVKTNNSNIKDRSLNSNNRNSRKQTKYDSRTTNQNNSPNKCDCSNLSSTKMMADVSLQKLKQELDRSMSHKKKKELSPYKEYSMTPAQLKYTSKSKNQQGGIHKTQKLSQRYRTQENDTYKNYQIRRSPTKLIKQLNYEESEYHQPKKYHTDKYSSYQKNDFQERISPLKLASKHPPCKYYDEENPEGHIMKNKKQSPIIKTNVYEPRQSPYKNNFFSNYNSGNTKNQKKSGREQRKERSPAIKSKLEELSIMYDDIKKRDKKNSPTKFTMNHGKGYKFHEEYEDFDKSLGLIKVHKNTVSPQKKSMLKESELLKDYIIKQNHSKEKNTRIISNGYKTRNL